MRKTGLWPCHGARTNTAHHTHPSANRAPGATPALRYPYRCRGKEALGAPLSSSRYGSEPDPVMKRAITSYGRPASPCTSITFSPRASSPATQCHTRNPSRLVGELSTTGECPEVPSARFWLMATMPEGAVTLPTAFGSTLIVRRRAERRRGDRDGRGVYGFPGRMPGHQRSCT